MELNYNRIDDVIVEGLDYQDYPDFCDAYVASAKYDDPVTGYRELTEDELGNLDNEWVREQVHDWIR